MQSSLYTSCIELFYDNTKHIVFKSLKNKYKISEIRRSIFSKYLEKILENKILVNIIVHDFEYITGNKILKEIKKIDFLHICRYINTNNILKYTNSNNYEKFYFTRTNEPILTVIIPVYNQEFNIEKCIKSVVSQSLKNIEIIIVDDCSTDNTYSTCFAWSCNDSRIIIEKLNKNSGQGVARNYALKKAKGKYVTFIDSDDVIEGNFFLHGVALLEYNNDLDLVHFGSKIVNTSNNKSFKECSILQSVSGRDALINYISSGKIKNYIGYQIWPKIIRRKLLLENRIEFSNHYFEDSIFLLKLFYHSRLILCLPDIVYCRFLTLHEASTCAPTSSRAKHLYGMFRRYEETEKFLRKIGIDENMIYEHFYRAFHALHKNLIFPYLFKFFNTKTNPITDDDLLYLSKTKILVRIIIEDYAREWAKNVGFNANITINELNNSCIFKKKPKDLITVNDVNSEDQIFLSIIIPVFNAQDTIKRCLNSILNQELQFFEIIAIDDCSTDSSLEILNYYSKKYNKIRLFKTNINSGQGTIRNLAVSRARGK